MCYAGVLQLQETDDWQRQEKRERERVGYEESKSCYWEDDTVQENSLMSHQKNTSMYGVIKQETQEIMFFRYMCLCERAKRIKQHEGVY